VQPAPGFPCTLLFFSRVALQRPGSRRRRGNAKLCPLTLFEFVNLPKHSSQLGFDRRGFGPPVMEAAMHLHSWTNNRFRR